MADSFSYDGFISYSHAADGLLAPRLQAGLQRFAKPWWKRRALRLFRDESSLSANPHLWSSITEALDRSGWFVLLLSPAAAGSEWVSQEIEYWITNREAGRILPVVTDGEFGWADGDVVGDAVPEALGGVFAEEPRWVDLRWAKDEDQLDLQDPRFADAVADIGSAIRGVPKDELASEEVRQHRRTVRTAWAAGAGLAALAVLAGILAVQSSNNAAEAERQAEVAAANAAEAESLARAEAAARTSAEESAVLESEARDEAQRNARLARSRELAAAAANEAGEDPQLAQLLALAAVDASPIDGIPSEVATSLWRTASADRLVAEIPLGNQESLTWLSLSRDGRWLAATGPDRLVLFDAVTLEPMWDFAPTALEDAVSNDLVGPVSVSPDGELVAVSVIDASSRVAAPAEDAVDDPRPGRVAILDRASGSIEVEISVEGCPSIDLLDWSDDSSLAAVTSGRDPCVRDGRPATDWVEVVETGTWSRVALIEEPSDFLGLAVSFDALDRLYIFGPGRTKLFSGPSYREPVELGSDGYGDASPTGHRVVTTAWSGPDEGWIKLFSTETGTSVATLTPFENFPRLPVGLRFSNEGRRVGSANDSNDVMVWNTATMELEARLPGGVAGAVEIDDSRDRAYTAHADGVIRVWDLGDVLVGRTPVDQLTAPPALLFQGFPLTQRHGAFVQDANDGSHVRFFERQTGEILDFSVPLAAGPEPVSVGERFLVATTPTVMAIVDPSSASVETLATCDSPALSDVCADGSDLTSLGRTAVSIGGDRVRLTNSGADDSTDWVVIDVASGETVDRGRTPARRFPIAFGEDWVFETSIATVAAYTAEDDLIFRTSVPQVHRVELSDSGERIAVYNSANVTVYEVGTWSAVVLPTTEGFVRGLAFDNAENRLAVADESAITVFDLETQLPEQSIPADFVTDLVWLDGSTLLVFDRSGRIDRLSIAPNELIADVRRQQLRSFSQAECSLFRIEPCPTLDEIRG